MVLLDPMLLNADWISPHVVPVIEILMIDVGLLMVYRFIRGSTGDSALKGISILLGATALTFYVLATNFELFRIKLLMQEVITYLIFAMIVIFQPELRRGVVRLGQNRIFGRLMPGKTDMVAVLTEGVFKLARNRTGALIAIERGVGLRDYAERGTQIDAHLSPELLDTIFHVGGPLHDGAVIIRGMRVIAAGCLFPLTDNMAISKRLGTRHRAGIGISEETDGISVIVSEETGRVSIAVRGELYQDLDRDSFDRALRTTIYDSSSTSVSLRATAVVDSGTDGVSGESQRTAVVSEAPALGTSERKEARA